MSKGIALLTFMMLAARCACAQLGLYQACRLQNAQGHAILGAQVYFLTQPANTIALTPLANVYGNSTGTVIYPIFRGQGQTTTDSFGNCSAYLAPGLYTVCYVSASLGSAPLCRIDQKVVYGNPTGPISPNQTSAQTTVGPISINSTDAVTESSSVSYHTVNINSMPWQAELLAQQGYPGVNSIVGALSVPSTGTMHQANGVAGFVDNLSSTTFAVGVYGQTVCKGSNQYCEAINSVAADTRGNTGVTLDGAEFDVNVNNKSTAVNGVIVNGAFNVTPLGAIGYLVAPPYGTGGPWSIGFSTATGAVSDILRAQPSGSKASSPSPFIRLQAYDSSGVVRDAHFNVDAFGNLQFYPYGAAIFNGPVGVTNPAVASFIPVVTEYAPNARDGEITQHFFGVSGTTNNSLVQQFMYSSNGSSSNAASWGFYGSANVFRFTPTGVFTAPTYANANGTLLPSTATGNTGSSTGKVSLVPGTEAFGIAVLSSGTITVSNGAACIPSATCVYKLTRCVANASTAVGVPSIGTVVAGTSFVITAETSANTIETGDQSSVCWQIN